MGKSENPEKKLWILHLQFSTLRKFGNNNMCYSCQSHQTTTKRWQVHNIHTMNRQIVERCANGLGSCLKRDIDPITFHIQASWKYANWPSAAGWMRRCRAMVRSPQQEHPAITQIINLITCFHSQIPKETFSCFLSSNHQKEHQTLLHFSHQVAIKRTPHRCT